MSSPREPVQPHPCAPRSLQQVSADVRGCLGTDLHQLGLHHGQDGALLTTQNFFLTNQDHLPDI